VGGALSSHRFEFVHELVHQLGRSVCASSDGNDSACFAMVTFRRLRAPMPGLMVSLEFRLHPMSSADGGIGHRVVHLAPLHPGGVRTDVTAPAGCISASLS